MKDLESHTNDELAIELAELKLHEAEPYLTEARKEQIRKEMAHISFELSERAKHGEQV